MQHMFYRLNSLYCHLYSLQYIGLNVEVHGDQTYESKTYRSMTSVNRSSIDVVFHISGSFAYQRLIDRVRRNVNGTRRNQGNITRLE